MSHYCRNKKLDREIRELQISVDYWKSYMAAYSEQTREHAEWIVMFKSNAIRRMKKLKR